jgi:hypothetical protein
MSSRARKRRMRRRMRRRRGRRRRSRRSRARKANRRTDLFGWRDRQREGQRCRRGEIGSQKHCAAGKEKQAGEKTGSQMERVVAEEIPQGEVSRTVGALA